MVGFVTSITNATGTDDGGNSVVGLPISKLNQFNWNGKSFIGPHGSVRPNFDALNDAEPTTLLNNLSPSTIDFVEEVYDEVADTITNYNYSISLNWDFIGLYTDSLGFDTRDGLFGLIGDGTNVDGFIDIGQGDKLIQNEGIQLLISYVLMEKGGSLGYFLSTFCRLNPHSIYQSLLKRLDREQIPFDGVPYQLTGNPNWLAMYPGSSESYARPLCAPIRLATIGLERSFTDATRCPTIVLYQHLFRIFGCW